MSIYSDHPIVGTWRLTSFSEQNLDTGAVSYPFGDNAKAMVIYEANVRVPVDRDHGFRWKMITQSGGT